MTTRSELQWYWNQALGNSSAVRFPMTTQYETSKVLPTYPDLAGKVAVVAGGTGGIGSATCRLLAANGARVVVNAREQTAIESVVDSIRSGRGEAIGVSAAKAGVIMYTRYLATEVGKHGIRVNCVAPGTVMTARMDRVIPAERRQQMAAMTALGRLGTPEDIAMATLFLASGSSSWITGATLDVNGGAVML